MSKFNNLSNRKFGRWTVTDYSHEKRSHNYWKVRCACGTQKIIRENSILKGLSASCGCLARELLSKRNQKRRRHHLPHQAKKKPKKKRKARLSGKKQCARRLRHGMSKMLAYKSWASMIRRCTNPKNQAYKYYGGRGIKVCDQWLNSFENFLKDMGERPGGLTLERINNNGNYEPSNCRWATPQEQTQNRRRCQKYKYRGEERFLSAWGKEYNMHPQTLRNRLLRGWPMDAALTRPIKKQKL